MTLCVLVDPPVVDQPDRHGVQEVQLLPARAAHDDKIRVLQHFEVLGDAEPRHLQLGLELRQRAAITPEQQVEQEATGRIGERLEHPIVVRHDAKLCDQ